MTVASGCPNGDFPTVTQVRQHLESRLDALPRYRGRLADPTAGGLAWQRWERDERFGIDRHVCEEHVPAPGGSCRRSATPTDVSA